MMDGESAVSYTIDYDDTRLPEIDAFFAEYVDLCRRHSMKMELETYSEGGGCITLAAYDGGDVGLFVSIERDCDVPCVKAEFARRDKADRLQREAAQRLSFDTAAAEKAAIEKSLRANGVALSDGLYRLVKVET